jgi:hypothetical protein
MKPANELTRDQKLTLIYRHTHKDFKGTHPELGKTIMVLRGASTLVSLQDLTDDEIADKLPGVLKMEERRLAKLAEKKAKAASTADTSTASAPAVDLARQAALNLHLVYKYTTGRVPNDGSGRVHKVAVYRIQPGKEMELVIKRTDRYVSEWQIARDAIKAAKIMPREAFREDGVLMNPTELREAGIAIVESI